MNTNIENTDNKLKIDEFQLLLEREYVQFAVCSLIFGAEFTDKYIEKMDIHKEKILDISFKVDSKTIFDDEDTLDYFVGVVIPENGAPKFSYRSDKAKEKMGTVLNSCAYNGVYQVEDIEGTIYNVIRNIPSRSKLIVEDLDSGQKSERSYSEFLCPIVAESIKEYINTINS